MSDDESGIHPIKITLRPIDRKRLDSLQERTATALTTENIWYIHTVLAQCFLPYKDPQSDRWHRKNGDFSIALTAGQIEDPRAKDGLRIAGLPFGAKPRLFQSYICTQAIKQQSPVIPVGPPAVNEQLWNMFHNCPYRSNVVMENLRKRESITIGKSAG